MWKITLFFSIYNVTWTETYYLPGSTSFSQVQSATIQLGLKRCAMNAKQVTWQATRVVLLSNPRQTQFIGTGNLPTSGTFTLTPGTDPDQDASPAFTSVQVKFFSTGSAVCRRYLAGAPEGIIGTQFTGRNIGVLGLWLNALNQLVQWLSAGGFAFRVLNQAGKQNSSLPTTSAQFPNEIGVSFQQQMIAQVAGQTNYLVLRGFRSANTRLFGIGGVYAVDPGSPGLTAVAAPYTYYLQNTSRISPSNIIKSGYGFQLAYSYPGFFAGGGPDGTGFSVLNATHHKRGVSALAVRGRLRTRP